MRTETFHEAREYQRKPPSGRRRHKYRRTPVPLRRFLTTTTRLTDPTASCLAAAAKTGWAADEEEPHPMRIHLRFDPRTLQIEIGYIGPKLRARRRQSSACDPTGSHLRRCVRDVLLSAA